MAQPLLGASPWRGELGSILSHATTGPFIWNRNHLGPRLQDARKGLGEVFLLRLQEGDVLPFPWAGHGTAGIHNSSHIGVCRDVRLLLVHPPMGLRSALRLGALSAACGSSCVRTGSLRQRCPRSQDSVWPSHGAVGAPALPPSPGGDPSASAAPGLRLGPGAGPRWHGKEGKTPCALRAHGPGRRIPAEGPAPSEGDGQSGSAALQNRTACSN